MVNSKTNPNLVQIQVQQNQIQVDHLDNTSLIAPSIMKLIQFNMMLALPCFTWNYFVNSKELALKLCDKGEIVEVSAHSTRISKAKGYAIISN